MWSVQMFFQLQKRNILNKLLNKEMNGLKCCVIVPTYNNQKTLKRVISGVLEYTNDVIVVNDGSTDNTTDILKEFNNQITVENLSVNSGKGAALRAGFKKAKNCGFEYGITIDSDGQHYPEDLTQFIETLKSQTEPTIYIGSRNMDQKSVPQKSSFGNKFSNFWFWFVTGKKLTDTQSGYRLYPLNSLPKKFYTTKFEFEIEVIVRASWKGVEVKNIPVKVLYDEQERVSHFRPFMDFTRISILNTVLVIISLIYIKPRDFINKFKKKSFKKFFLDDVVGSKDSNQKKSFSLALGVFIGIIPIWGFQTLAVISLSVFLNLNKFLSFAASNISIPPMIPLIVLSSLKIGGLILNNEVNDESATELMSFQQHLLEYLVGSLVLATITAIFVGFTSYFLLTSFKYKRTPK